MPVTTSKVNYTSYYVFGSPKYNAIYNKAYKYIPDNYNQCDDDNGTYDFFFPLMRVTSSPVPVVMYQKDEELSVIKGAFALKEYTRKGLVETYGADPSKRQTPSNTTLEQQSISYSWYSNIPLHPGWDVLQSNVLIKVLGNLATISTVHAIKLDEVPFLLTALPVNTFVLYKNNVWRCKNPTTQLPPVLRNAISLMWEYIHHMPVFTASIYAISGNFLFTVTDTIRTFDPVQDADNNLVTWNVAYFNA